MKHKSGFLHTLTRPSKALASIASEPVRWCPSVIRTTARLGEGRKSITTPAVPATQAFSAPPVKRG